VCFSRLFNQSSVGRTFCEDLAEKTINTYNKKAADILSANKPLKNNKIHKINNEKHKLKNINLTLNITHSNIFETITNSKKDCDKKNRK
jgi:hypothetical protein